jgi:undecaprenyl-diphosphatase
MIPLLAHSTASLSSFIHDMQETIRQPVQSTSRPGIWLLASALFCVLAVAGFLGIAHLVETQQSLAFDQQAVVWFAAHRHPLSSTVLLLVTALGDSWILTGWIIGLLLVWLPDSRRWPNVVGLLLASGGAGILNETLKLAYQRPRPDFVPTLLHPGGYSFPSGHAMIGLACYGALLFIFWPRLRSRAARVALALGIGLLGLLLGLSRLYWGVHYPTDVLAGYLAGVAWLLVAMNGMWLIERWRCQNRGSAL